MATLDVVVVTYNSREVLAGCLAAAGRIAGVGEVVAVDHGGDGSGRVAEAAGARAVCDARNRGFGAGQNRGLRETKAPFVLMLNPDALVTPDAVARGVAFLEAEPDVAALQGVIVNRSTGQPERSQGVELGPVHLFGRALGVGRMLTLPAVAGTARSIGLLGDHVHRVPDGPRAVQSLSATALLVRRSAVAAVDGFDESYFLYGEDLDLCRRLRQRGWRLVALPDQWAVHQSGGSSASEWERELHWWRGTMQFAAEWWPPLAWWAAIAAATLRWARLVAHQPNGARRAWRALVGAPRVRRRAPRPARGRMGSSGVVPHLPHARLSG